MIFDNLQNTRASESLQRFGRRVFRSVLGERQRKTDVTARFVGELPQILAAAADSVNRLLFWVIGPGTVSHYGRYTISTIDCNGVLTRSFLLEN